MADIHTVNDSPSPSANRTSSQLACLVSGWGLLFYFIIRVAWSGSIAANVRAYQITYTLAFVGYMLLMRQVMQTAARGMTLNGWWLISCVALRLMAVGVAPSDDVHRYLWEGRIQQAGHNPYALAPDDAQLISLRDESWSKINHRDYPAIYGPVAQLEFRIAAAIYPAPITFKILHTLWDILTLLVLGLCLRRMGYPPSYLLLYALCPLTLSAFAVEGHLDSLMLLLLMVGVFLELSRRSIWAGAVLGLAVSVKITAAIFLLWYLRRSWKTLMVAVVVFLLSYLPYVDAGWGLVESLSRFGQADFFFSLTRTLGLTDLGPDPIRWASIVALAVLLLVLLWRTKRFVDYGYAACGVFLLLTPVLHYWYLTWVLAWIPLVIGGSQEPNDSQSNDLPSNDSRANDSRANDLQSSVLQSNDSKASDSPANDSQVIDSQSSPPGPSSPRPKSSCRRWPRARVTLPYRWLFMAGAMAVYFEAEHLRVTTGTWAMPDWAPQVAWILFAVGWLLDKLRDYLKKNYTTIRLL